MMVDGLGPGHLAFNLEINNELQVDGVRHCMNAHIRSIVSVHKCFGGIRMGLESCFVVTAG